MIQRLEFIRRREQPILYLPNWLNASMADRLRERGDKSGRGPHRPVRLLYAGNIGTKQDLLRFCETLHASEAQFAFRIHGDGGHAETIRTWLRQTGDPRLTFGPFLEETGFAAALHETDFFVITEKTGSGGSFIPCKMIPGISSGSPILAVCDGDSPLGREMRNEQPGPWFSWEQLASIPAFLDEAPEKTDPFRRWQENALRRAAFHERDNVIARFEGAIRAIVDADGDVTRVNLTSL